MFLKVKTMFCLSLDLFSFPCHIQMSRIMLSKYSVSIVWIDGKMDERADRQRGEWVDWWMDNVLKESRVRNHVLYILLVISL